MSESIWNIRRDFQVGLKAMYPHPELFDGFYWSIDDIVDQAIFDYIRLDYNATAPKKSLRQYYKSDVLWDDAARRKYSRVIERLQHYRDIQNEELEAAFDVRHPGLERRDMQSIEDKLDGYHFNRVEFDEIDMEHDIPILQKLVGKQVDDPNNVRFAAFVELISDYINYVQNLEKHTTSDLETIESTIKYFNLEWRFNINILYALSTAAAKQGKLNSIPRERIYMIFGGAHLFPGVSWCRLPLYHIEKRMFMKRNKVADDIFTMTDEEWAARINLHYDSVYMENFLLQAFSREQMLGKLREIPIEEKAEFIRKHYWLWDASPNFAWTKTAVYNFRKIHSALTKDMPIPHVK